MLNDAEKSQLISLIIKQGFRSTNPEILALCDKFTDTSETISLPVRHDGMGSIVDKHGDELMVVSIDINPDTIVKVLNDDLLHTHELALAMNIAIKTEYEWSCSEGGGYRSMQQAHDYLFPTITTIDAESCDGCLYRNTKSECKPCTSDERDDGRDVIYVKGGV